MTYLEDQVHLTPDGQVEVAAIFCSSMAESEMVQDLYRNRRSVAVVVDDR